MTANILTRDGIAESVRAEQAALATLVAGVSDEDWTNRTRDDGWTVHHMVAHIGDSLLGIDRLVRGQLPPGAFDIDQINAHRYQQNIGLSRAEVETKLSEGFATILATIDETTDLDAPGPFGPDMTIGAWLALAAQHTAGHREQVEHVLL